MSGKALRETIGLLGVVASLVFVGMEIHGNTVASQAAAYQAIGVATAEMHLALAQDPAMERLLTNDRAALAEMSDLERLQIRRVMLAWLRMGETVYLQVESGLLPADGLATLGYENALGNLRSACLWPTVRNGVGPSFRAYLEETKDFDSFDCSGLLGFPD